MDLDILKIDLKGLADGLNSFEFDLDDAYFKAVNAPEVGRGNVHVSLKIVRTQNDYFTLDFHEKGTVVLPCDLCLDDMEQPIETQQRLEAKFGNAYSEDGDLVTVPENEGILDVSWFVYEFILLALPIKHVQKFLCTYARSICTNIHYCTYDNFLSKFTAFPLLLTHRVIAFTSLAKQSTQQPN